MYTYFIYTVPNMARVAFFKINSTSTTVRGTLYTHFIYAIPHIARVAFFKRNSIPTTVRGSLYKHFVNTVPHIARVEILNLIHLEERCTPILYTPFLIWLE